MAPAEINVIPLVANTKTIPEMNFFALRGPDLALDDFGCRIIMLDHPGGRIALRRRRIAGFLNRRVSSSLVPRRFQCFAKAEHEAVVRTHHLIADVTSGRITLAQTRTPEFACLLRPTA